jgi:predicted negative regulator of RcsB-dependent stress response
LKREESPLTDFVTEEEQIQQIKNWVKQYGMTVLAGIAIAFMITSGWRYWQNYKTRNLLHASAVYDEMLTVRAQGNVNATLTQANKLKTHYTNSPYAQMAAFMLARDAVLKKNYEEATTQLKWVMDKTSEISIRQIARLRLARVLIAEQKPEAALDLLKKTDDKTFAGLIDEVRGDAFLSMKNTAAAHDAYQLAVNELPNAEVARPTLQMKLDNLATS